MNTNLISIEVYKKKPWMRDDPHTVFWFLQGSKDDSFLPMFSLYVTRSEGARVIKRLGIKPKKIKRVVRGDHSVELILQ